MLLPVANAAALWRDRVEVFVSETITHDNNVFRLSNAADPVTTIGSSSTADTYTTTGLGFRFDVPVSRQRFLGELGWNHNRYNRFTEFNFTDNNARAVWEWQAGNKLSGQLGYTQRKSLTSLSNVQSGVQSTTPNPIHKQGTFFDAAYMLTPRWRLKGELTDARASNTIPELLVNDIDIDGTGFGVSYISPAGNEVGVNIRIAEAQFPFPQLVAGNLVDNAYRQRNAGLVTNWTISGHSRLNAQLGRVDRNYEQFPERNFDDTTYHAAYEWKATGKLSLTAEAQRDISPYEEVNTNAVLLHGIALRPSFDLTEKINISGALEHNNMDYLGDAGLVLGTVQPRSDRMRVAALRILYRPIRHAWAEAALRREDRSSSDPFGDYEVNIVSVTAGIRF
jgi:exopolysaccharide biosynthesis operon protein EpsL